MGRNKKSYSKQNKISLSLTGSWENSVSQYIDTGFIYCFMSLYADPTMAFHPSPVTSNGDKGCIFTKKNILSWFLGLKFLVLWFQLWTSVQRSAYVASENRDEAKAHGTSWCFTRACCSTGSWDPRRQPFPPKLPQKAKRHFASPAGPGWDKCHLLCARL